MAYLNPKQTSPNTLSIAQKLLLNIWSSLFFSFCSSLFWGNFNPPACCFPKVYFSFPFPSPGREAQDDQRRGHPVRHVHTRVRQLRRAAEAVPPGRVARLCISRNLIKKFCDFFSVVLRPSSRKMFTSKVFFLVLYVSDSVSSFGKKINVLLAHSVPKNAKQVTKIVDFQSPCRNTASPPRATRPPA